MFLLLIFATKAQAWDIQTVCSFSNDVKQIENTKFTTYLNQGGKDTSYGSYTSGLQLQDNGVTLNGWQPVWCFSQSSTDVRTDVRSDSLLPSGDNAGYFAFRVDSVTNQSGNGFYLVNQSDLSQKLPFTICMGTKDSGLTSNCNSTFGQFAIIRLGTPDEIKQFNKALLPTKNNSKNPFNPGLIIPFLPKYHWRVASNVIIPSKVNVKPGIYQGVVVVTLQVKFQGKADPLPSQEVNGKYTFSSNYQVFIQKDCQLGQYIKPINFPEASFVKNIQDISTSLTVRCTLGTDYSINMKGKNDKGSNHDQHYMLDSTGKHEIPYALYKGDRTTMWQYDPSGVKDTGTGTGESQKIEVWGKINKGSAEVPAGEYTDTITVELTY